jgi:ABC-type uncharacterized transport system substrate-binding protein
LKNASAVGEDPVKLGLVASLARPGGNATGINIFNVEVATKRLGLLHELVPKAVRIAVLVNPANATSAEFTLRYIPEAARAIGLQTQVLNASTRNEIDTAFANLVRERADALFVAAATPRRARSAMSDGKRSYLPSNQWYSTAAFWPSMVPVSLRPLRNAVT